MTVATISPKEAKLLIDKGAILVDVRGPGEFAGEHIAKAINTPIPELGNKNVGDGKTTIVYYCKSGMRTKMAAPNLAAAATAKAFIISGGIEGWKSAGFAVERAAPSEQGSLLSRITKLFS